MKKTIVTCLLAVAFTLGATAQTKTFVQAGVSAGVERRLNENLEVGLEAKNNRVSVIGQTFSDTSGKRRYFAGIKYLRLIPVLPNLSATLSLAGKTRVDNTALYVIEPGAGLDFNLGKGINLVAGITSPISQKSFSERTTTFAGNASLKFNL